jgi:hypothetical protein
MRESTLCRLSDDHRNGPLSYRAMLLRRDMDAGADLKIQSALWAKKILGAGERCGSRIRAEKPIELQARPRALLHQVGPARRPRINAHLRSRGEGQGASHEVERRMQPRPMSADKTTPAVQRRRDNRHACE